MKILAISDTHGHLPLIPECDVLLIAGDICPIRGSHHPEDQLAWLDRHFRPWLRDLPVGRIVGIAGNHDFVFEDLPVAVSELHLPWTYLQDFHVVIDGVMIYGIPWVPNLPGWAFHHNKANLKVTFDAVPRETDIMLSHGPPYGYGDRIGYLHVGSKSGRDMLDRVRPIAFVCGHIHEGYGSYTHVSQHHGTTDIYNVSFLDAVYQRRRAAATQEIVMPSSDDVKIDGQQNTTDGISAIHDPDSDTRSPSESPPGP